MRVFMLVGCLGVVLFIAALRGRRYFWTEEGRGHPDAIFWVGWFSVHPDDMWVPGFLVNFILENIGSRRRLRIVCSGESICTIGIWTPKQAVKVASQMKIGEDCNFHYAKERSGILRPLQFLGIIE